MHETSEEKPVADAAPMNWVDRHAPERLKPYLRLARLDRPIGTWLLLWPCWWGIALAAPQAGQRFPDLVLMILFAFGAVLMRGAGCTYNDIVDRDLDAKVARTRGRPLPSGAVGVRAAWRFIGLQAGLAFLVLLLFNRLTITLGVVSLVLVALYPFAKRVTFWPQAVLGLAFNWGALMGFTAAVGTLATPALLLYAAGFLWTLGYDTIYAHQDKEDDALIGVKSTALRFGRGTQSYLWIFYGVCVLLLVLAGLSGGMGFAFWPLLIPVGAHFAYQIVMLDIDDPESCLKLFRANREAGGLIFLALFFGALTA
jgi:4-hydroxybenzoate polyprenyltransferase